MQKLEDEPRLDYENLHRGYDGVRPSAPDRERLDAWARGETGLPFLDACMRALRATGWPIFRMRARVMATASQHLWLHWRSPGLALARLFTDYEPGIHWSQAQRQSGATGINTVRVAVYADAYEWVEAPNVIGMSQFADGGLFSSKPYAASGNYIHKMSNHCAGCRYDVK